MTEDFTSRERISRAAGHLAFGWGGHFAFIALGALLEALHGFKSGLYLDVPNETRRLMWTLSHAHGTLFGLIHVALALSLPHLPALSGRGADLASRSLYAGSVAMPLGFFLGGAFAYEGDPGLAIVLAPVGAGLVLIAAWIITLAAYRSRTGS